VSHLFFECCVARLVWSEIAEISGKEIGTDFESVAISWVADKKYRMLNVCSAAALWAIWKLRNEFFFQGTIWSGVQVLLRKITRMLRDWRLLNKPEAVVPWRSGRKLQAAKDWVGRRKVRLVLLLGVQTVQVQKLVHFVMTLAMW
jgi:hypothetical protein